MIPNRAPQSIPPETLLSALAEPERLVLYLSRGLGPPPRRLTPEQPEFVRVAVMTSAPLAGVQAAREEWLARGSELVGGRLEDIEAGELVAPPAESRWAGVPAAGRAKLLVRGAELLVSLAPEIGVFHINDEFGAGLLVRVQAELMAGEGWMDVHTLEHLVFASLTYRLLVHTGEAVVVTGTHEATWSLRQVFPEHAAVWRRSLGRAPMAALGGLAFAGLAERVVWASATQRGREEVAAGPPAIAAGVAEAASAIKRRLTDLLRERSGGRGN